MYNIVLGSCSGNSASDPAADKGVINVLNKLITSNMEQSGFSEQSAMHVRAIFSRLFEDL